MTWFVGSASGEWTIDRCDEVIGDALARVSALAVLETPARDSNGAAWILRGVPSYERYVNTNEQAALTEVSRPLGRPQAVRAALIPITKSGEWWALPADRRRAIFEESSQHISTGIRYLPAVARRLYHGRDLGEPFDFLTWFEYAPHDADAFESLVDMLRSTEEWRYVVREVDIRLSR